MRGQQASYVCIDDDGTISYSIEDEFAGTIFKITKQISCQSCGSKDWPFHEEYCDTGILSEWAWGFVIFLNAEL